MAEAFENSEKSVNNKTRGLYLDLLFQYFLLALTMIWYVMTIMFHT